VPQQTNPWPGHPAIERYQPRNLLLLATHQVVLRVGWIFKTESVIMPAFLDAVAGPGAGWVRGFLPVLNRFGQSLPPVFLADRLKAMRQKKWSLAAFTGATSLPLLALAVLWLGYAPAHAMWMAVLILGLYLAFHVFFGLYQLSFGTVQGKLIRPTRRGQLLLISTFWGAFPAALFALWLLPGWLSTPGGSLPRFHWIFGWVVVCFALAAVVVMVFLLEPGDRAAPPAERNGGSLADVLRALRGDANLRRLVLVAMLFGSCIIVFPHYQALALQKLRLPEASLMLFVVAQNVAVGVFGLVVGPLADRRGNRLTLRLLIFGSAIAPAFAASLVYMPPGLAAGLCWMIFIPLGITPLVLMILVNYTLEICRPAEHPRYLSTVSLCVAVPFLAAPLAGWAVDAVSFQFVFLLTVCLLVLSGLMTFRLDEPRYRVRETTAPPPGTGD
jgi:hypothetical protein